MRQVYLHTFYRHQGAEITDNLVIIPIGGMMERPPAFMFNDALEKSRLVRLAHRAGINLILPYDDNIYRPLFNKMTHAPRDLAAMLLEAVTARDGNHYCYHHIYLTGQFDTHRTMAEFNTLLQTTHCPVRTRDLKIFGYGGAASVQYELGVKRLGIPVCHYTGTTPLITDIHATTAGKCALTPLTDSAAHLRFMTGAVYPAYAKINNSFSPPTGAGFWLAEPTDWAQTDYLIHRFKNKSDVLILSADTPIPYQLILSNELSENLIFSGAPFGLKKHLNYGRPITLFTPAELTQISGRFILSWANSF